MSPTPSQIKRVRKSANLTQEASARLMNVSVFSWHSWEQGRRKMSADLFASFKEVVRRV